MAWVGPAIPAPGGGRTRSLGGRLTYYGAVELCGGREIAGVQTEDQVVRVNDIVEVEVAVRVSGHHHQGKKSESTAADQQPYLAQVTTLLQQYRVVCCAQNNRAIISALGAFRSVAALALPVCCLV